jgi:hypothetical protein
MVFTVGRNKNFSGEILIPMILNSYRLRKTCYFCFDTCFLRKNMFACFPDSILSWDLWMLKLVPKERNNTSSVPFLNEKLFQLACFETASVYQIQRKRHRNRQASARLPLECIKTGVFLPHCDFQFELASICVQCDAHNWNKPTLGLGWIG